MPADVTVRGIERLERIGRHLKETGDKGLRKELYRGINRATKPMKAAVKEAARDELPSSGGLNEFVASARISTSVRTSGLRVGVSIRGRKSGHDLRAIDRGRLRHPVFGNRRVWVTQAVKPGWFTDTLRKEAKAVRKEIRGALATVAKRMTRG